MTLDRRQILKYATGSALTSALAACATAGSGSGPHVVVVGGGFGGATDARYLRMWSEGKVNVTLVEPEQSFISCPFSNLVLGGFRTMADITLERNTLSSVWGVRQVRDRVTQVDAAAKKVRLAGGDTLSYDRLVLSPGIDFMYDTIPGLETEQAREKVLHAWKAGAQTVALRKQLEAMPDGGVYAISIPKAPYRCPPGPYERASVVAAYFKTNKPKSKVVILDANEKIQSKEGLFKKAWEDLYPGLIEYRANSALKKVDANTGTAYLDFDNIKADVLNVIPPHRAGSIATSSGLKLINNNFVDVNWLSMESVNTPGVHVLGDATFPAPLMPKSGHMANQHAKLAAAAILNMLEGREPNPTPLVMNTCYSFVGANSAIHVASVHEYDATAKTMKLVTGSGGISAARSSVEAKSANAWARNIWADMLA
jgi:sulfite dehydrogenase